MNKPISSTLRIRPPDNFTVGLSSPLTLDEWSGVMARHTDNARITLDILQNNIFQQEIEPTPWYRRAWFKVADLIGRVPDAWAVLRGRARIEMEDW